MQRTTTNTQLATRSSRLATRNKQQSTINTQQTASKTEKPKPRERKKMLEGYVQRSQSAAAPDSAELLRAPLNLMKLLLNAMISCQLIFGA